MISPDAIRALELGALASALEARCCTVLGSARAQALAPLPDAAAAALEAARVSEWCEALVLGLDVELSAPPAAAELLEALGKSGIVLTGEELAGLGKLAASAARALTFLATLDAPALRSLAPSLAGSPASSASPATSHSAWPSSSPIPAASTGAAPIPATPMPAGRTSRSPLPELRAAELALRRALDDEGRLLDGASPDLSSIQSRRRVARERLDRMVERYFESHTELSERIATLREDRTVVAVRSDLGASRYGLVHGRSSSGATVYVEPFELVEPNNQAVMLREEEAAECQRILRELTVRLAEIRPELIAAAELVGQLDFVRARARLGRDTGGVRAEQSRDGRIELEDARHPLLVLDAMARGGGIEVVPLTLKLAAGESLVITGPNTGGKTVALKTVGLAALLYACGVPVTARKASLPFLRTLHIDIGDPQDISQSLSTFSGHVGNVVRALADLEAAGFAALVLLDELGAGTDPREGSALAIAVLERLRACGATTLVTSHHEALKRYALGTAGVRAAAVEFDEVTLRPTYRLLVDRAGSSNALIIAERLGMPAEVVGHARRLLAGEEGELERALARLDLLSRQSEAAAVEADLARASLEEQRTGLAGREQDVARREAELRSRESGVKARLREESEARLAALLQELRREGNEVLANLASEAERKRLDQKLSQRLAEATFRAEALVPDAAAPSDSSPITDGTAAPGIGDRVRVRGFGTVGTLVALAGGRAEVEALGKRLRVDAATLERMGSGEARREDRVSLAIASRDGVEREINLVGMTVEDALIMVDKLLDRALLARLPEVRIIHGHGTGRLRTGVQQHLKSHPAVRAIETVSQGGATRALLEE